MELDVMGSCGSVTANNVICLARTYRKHAEELGNPVPDEPIVFQKPNSSLMTGGMEIVIPPGSREVHHEVELAVVIRKGGRSIPAERALEYVLGYAVILDITARDIQSELKSKGLPWTYAKGWDTFAPISRVMPMERVPDPHDLSIKLTVSGEVRQNSNTSFMMFSVPEIIEFISGFMTLQRGDIIATGTPEGVGPLVAGDTTFAEIEKVGTLENTVVQG